jgi:hypothetical protein
VRRTLFVSSGPHYEDIPICLQRCLVPAIKIRPVLYAPYLQPPFFKPCAIFERITIHSQNSSIILETSPRAGRQRNRGLILQQGHWIILFSTTRKPALGPT